MQGIATLPYEVQTQPLIPDGGLQTIKHAADMLADFGRHGDIYMVHAAGGETVIPLKVLDANPRMKRMIFRQMEELGLEPEQYIVGNELNSINPITGVREFGFLSKVFKGVKKIVKVAAPLVLAVAAPYLLPAMPAFLSAGLGSLAGNLIAGERDPKKLAFNAVLSGLFTGGSKVFKGGSFFESADKSIGGLGDLFSTSPTKWFEGAKNPLEAATYFGEGATWNKQLFGADPQPKPLQMSLPPDMPNTQNITTQAQANATGLPIGSVNPDFIDTGLQPVLQKDKSWISRNIWEPGPGEGALESYISPSRQSIQTDPGQAAADVAKQISEAQARMPVDPTTGYPQALPEAVQTAMYEKAMTAADPSVFQKWGPAAVVAGGAALGADYLSGGQVLGIWTPEDPEGLGYPTQWKNYQTGQLLYQDPEKYGLGGAEFYGDNPAYGPQHVPAYQGGTAGQQVATVAKGGEIVGPGTPTSDSIPALLSDGEFVVNAATVNAVGGGDRKEGARRLYAMQRAYEQRAA
jgi:hypothetical protein